MNDKAMADFREQMTQKLAKKFELKWDVDKKGVVWGWCKLKDPEDIYTVAQIVAGCHGRIMTISALNTPSDLVELTGAPKPKEPINLVINYHFYFDGINCTVAITLPDKQRTVKSITPVLISADWHEREMQDLFNIKLQGHPNPRRLFLDKSIHMDDHTMIPLSEAMDGACTNTLWEKIMQSGKKGRDTDEQL